MTKKEVLWLVLILLTAAGLRFSLLPTRPMHTDEAVQAQKLAILFDTGTWKYDPAEFHGSTLLFFTLPAARLAGITAGCEMNETLLRSVPAWFGMLLVLTPFFFAEALGRRAMFFAAVLLGFSPAFVFYSRYYIQEMLFVFFMACFLGSGWKYLRKPSVLAAVLTGIFAGLMFATKETAVLVVVAVLLAWIAVSFKTAAPKSENSDSCVFRPAHIAAAIAVFLGIWLLFFSSFGSNPGGIPDSLRSFWNYLFRAGGAQGHRHPWYFYLDLLTWIEFLEPVAWNEDLVVVLAGFAVFTAFRLKKTSTAPFRLFRWMAFFTLSLTALYSAIPYKTPWNILPFLYGMCILAGVSADWAFHAAAEKWEKRILAAVLILFAILAPAAQSVLLNTFYAVSPSNPYVYGHTGTDIFPMAQAVQKAALAQPQGKDLYIQVFAPGNDYWPWPWYLRSFNRVGWWDAVDPNLPPAPLILADAKLHSQVLDLICQTLPPGRRTLYLSLFDRPMFLRPGVEWNGYIRKDLWDRMQTLPAGPLPADRGSRPMQILPEETMPRPMRFSHEAMNADFEIFIDHDNPKSAASAARAAFDEIDRLERLLSRYIPNSDIRRIAALKKGQSAVVSPETMQCLQIAGEISALTGGAFDITVGALIEAWKGDAPPSEANIEILHRAVGMNLLELNPTKMTVTALADGICVDLGGIGKGFALTRTAEVLREWGVARTLIHGGASSVLALDPPRGRPGWKIRLSDPRSPSEAILHVEMANEALGCSGLRRDRDMIDPRSGRPVDDKTSVWIKGPDPARCDALSTALMIMETADIETFAEQNPRYAILILPKSQAAPLRLGAW